jgi:hypothetical protein
MFLHLLHEYLVLFIYSISIICLCRDFATGLNLSLVLWISATPSVVVWWFSCVDRVVCLQTVPSSRLGKLWFVDISVVGSPHHDHDAKCSLFPRVLVGLWCQDHWPLLRLYGMDTMDSTSLHFLPAYDEPIMA